MGQQSEDRKHASNDAKCLELGWVCVPLAVKVCGPEAQANLSQPCCVPCNQIKFLQVPGHFCSLWQVKPGPSQSECQSSVVPFDGYWLLVSSPSPS